MMNKARLAVLDFYNGIPNQGMQCIQNLLQGFPESIEYRIFDVRTSLQLPDIKDFDIFICSGGPGDPLSTSEHWMDSYLNWLDVIWANNLDDCSPKKHILFICYSFQLAVLHFKLAKVSPRQSISFGTFPTHPTKSGETDLLFRGLETPFHVADFRHHQVTEPDLEQMAKIGATTLALEKIRPHVDLDRAIMAIRWSKEIVGLQFHPEADASGMMNHFSRPEIKLEVIRSHGREKWLSIMNDLHDERKIKATHDSIIPNFLKASVEAISTSDRMARLPN